MVTSCINGKKAAFFYLPIPGKTSAGYHNAKNYQSIIFLSVYPDQPGYFTSLLLSSARHSRLLL